MADPVVFELLIGTDNAAFDDPAELPRILREVADRLDGEALGVGTRGTVRDANGNTVGGYGVGLMGPKTLAAVIEGAERVKP